MCINVYGYVWFVSLCRDGGIILCCWLAPFFCLVYCFLWEKRSKLYVSILSMCEYVWECVGVNKYVWVCMNFVWEWWNCFFVWRWGDYIISISSCRSCWLVSLLDDGVIFLVILKRKVDMNCFLWGGEDGWSWFLEGNRRNGISINVL